MSAYSAILVQSLKSLEIMWSIMSAGRWRRNAALAGHQLVAKACFQCPGQCARFCRALLIYHLDMYCTCNKKQRIIICWVSYGPFGQLGWLCCPRCPQIPLAVSVHVYGTVSGLFGYACTSRVPPLGRVLPPLATPVTSRSCVTGGTRHITSAVCISNRSKC